MMKMLPILHRNIKINIFRIIFLVSSNYSAVVFAEGLHSDIYASLRMQTQFMSVDHAVKEMSSDQIGFEDAYSRIGGNLNYALTEIDFAAQIELSVNTAHLRLEDPTFFDHSPVRIARFSASSKKWGSFWLGKGWLPYYNNIAAPVDYFSSRYSGYATYAYFREYAFSYTTPELLGVVASISKIKRTDHGAKGTHVTLAYSVGGLTIAAGKEKMKGHLASTSGVALSYTKGSWLSSFKFERNDNAGKIANAFLQYSLNKITYKGMWALGDQYSGRTFHLGLDYQVNSALKLFAEYYGEKNNYAILSKKAKAASHYLGAGGFSAEQNGRVWALGLRYDLSRVF